MAATAVAHGVRSPSGPGAVDLEGSIVSSPLSEVEDDTNEDIEHMQLDRNGPVGAGLSPDANHDGSDSDSALSDAASDVNSDVNDTEAETERLYDTPKNQKQRDFVDQFNNGQVFEHTPSKLRSATGAVADRGNRDDFSLFGDEESAASSVGGRDTSPAKPAATTDSSIDEEAKLVPQERKRKRSPVADPSESDHLLSKRNGSLGPPGATAEQDTPMNEDDATSANPQSGHHSGGEDETSSSSNRGLAAERKTRSTKKSKRTASKRKGLLASDAGKEADSDAREDPGDVTVEDDAERPDEEPDGDAEEETDIAARNIEESESPAAGWWRCVADASAVQRKHAAFRDWTHIEDMFNVLRERSVEAPPAPRRALADAAPQTLQRSPGAAGGGGAVSFGRRADASRVPEHEEVHRRPAEQEAAGNRRRIRAPDEGS